MSVSAGTIEHLSPFKELPREFTEEFAALCVPRTFAESEVVYSHGREQGRMFLLIAGEVRVYQSSGGRKVITGIFKEGDFFGDLSFAHPAMLKQEHFAQAHEQSRVCVVLNDDMVGLIRKFPQFAMLLLTTLRDRLHHAESKIRDLAIGSAETRVLNELIRYALRHGKEEEGRYLIKERLTHQMLADMTGLTRETVTKTLKFLQRRGFVSLTPEKLFVLHTQKILDECVECIRLSHRKWLSWLVK